MRLKLRSLITNFNSLSCQSRLDGEFNSSKEGDGIDEPVNDIDHKNVAQEATQDSEAQYEDAEQGQPRYTGPITCSRAKAYLLLEEHFWRK